jgi:hypothetical protein
LLGEMGEAVGAVMLPRLLTKLSPCAEQHADVLVYEWKMA